MLLDEIAERRDRGVLAAPGRGIGQCLLESGRAIEGVEQQDAPRPDRGADDANVALGRHQQSAPRTAQTQGAGGDQLRRRRGDRAAGLGAGDVHLATRPDGVAIDLDVTAGGRQDHVAARRVVDDLHRSGTGRLDGDGLRLYVKETQVRGDADARSDDDGAGGIAISAGDGPLVGDNERLGTGHAARALRADHRLGWPPREEHEQRGCRQSNGPYRLHRCLAYRWSRSWERCSRRDDVGYHHLLSCPRKTGTFRYCGEPWRMAAAGAVGHPDPDIDARVARAPAVAGAPARAATPRRVTIAP